MNTETFFLAEDSHRISTLSLREKLSLHDHKLARCPKNEEIKVTVADCPGCAGGDLLGQGQGMASGEAPCPLT
jgi:hypothetical protein